MQDWIQIEKKPITIGKCSRGFIIPKVMISLDSRKEYIVRVIPKEDFYNEKGDLNNGNANNKY